MRPALAFMVATATLAFAATESLAQMHVAPAPRVVYRPVSPAYAYPAYAAPRVIVNRPVVYAGPVVNPAPMPTVTNYAPAASTPIVTNYAPAASASVVTNYAPSPAPIPAAPVYSPAPIVTYRPALPVVTYRQPLSYIPPTVVGYPGYAGNVSTVYAVPVASPAVIVRPKVYYPGQPVRNFFRAVTP